MKKVLIFGLLIGVVQALWAAQPTPAYLQPEVIKAAVAINLTEAQKPQFQQSLTRFFDGRIKATNLLLRRNSQTGVPRKIKSKTNALLKEMNKEMAGFLTEEQMPAYNAYAKVFKSNLIGM